MLFRFELIEAIKPDNYADVSAVQEAAQSLAMKRAESLYILSKIHIFDVDFEIKALEVAIEFPFARRLQNSLIREMMKRFPASEKTWNTLAQRELHGFAVKDIFVPITTTHDPEQDTKLSPDKRIEMCAKVYNKATKIIKSKTMWTYFIDAMTEVYNDPDTPGRKTIKKKYLLIAYKRGHEASALTEQQYLVYIDLLNQFVSEGDHEQLLITVLQYSTRKYSENIELWGHFLSYYTTRNDAKNAELVFSMALKTVKDKLTMWKMMKRYQFITFGMTDSRQGYDEMLKLFWRGVNEPEPISSCFKVEFIEWMALVRGIDNARKLFKDLASKRSTECYELHLSMIKLNKQLLSPTTQQTNLCNIEATKDCFLFSLECFGRTKPDLWIEYIKFEQIYGETKINIIHENAKQILEPEHIEYYCNQFNVINCN